MTIVTAQAVTALQKLR